MLCGPREEQVGVHGVVATPDELMATALPRAMLLTRNCTVPVGVTELGAVLKE